MAPAGEVVDAWAVGCSVTHRKACGKCFFCFPSVESAIVGQAKLGLVPTPQVRVSLTQLETQWKQNDSAQVYTMEKTYLPRPETGWGYGPFTKKGETVILLTTRSWSRFNSWTEL